LLSFGQGRSVVVVVVVNKSLEVSYFDILTDIISIDALDERVQLNLIKLDATIQQFGMLLKQLLNDLITLEVVLSQAKDFKSLLLGDESSFDTKSLLSHLLSALVAIFFHLALIPLLFKVFQNFSLSLF
jgi:hypothetical protein